MRQKRVVSSRVRLVAAALVLGVAAPVASYAASGQHPSPAGRQGGVTQLLPDLNPLEPRGPAIVSSDGRWVLAFGAASDNLGTGPLIIHGARPDVSTPFMTATQTVLNSDGSSVSYPDAGQLVYAVQPDHQHWHYLNFMTYQLRSATGDVLVRPAQKTGFCLTDDYRSVDFDPKHDPANTPPQAVYTQRCDLNQPTALSVDEGISIGYGDYYNPLLEGQSIDLTGVPSGRYYLVVSVNQSRAIHESDYTNDAASIQIALTQSQDPSVSPAMRVLSICRDGGTCPVKIALGASATSAPGSRIVKVTASASLATTATLRIRVGGRVVAQVRRSLHAGVTHLGVRLPTTLSRPARCVVTVLVGGDGIQPAKVIAATRLR